MPNLVGDLYLMSPPHAVLLCMCVCLSIAVVGISLCVCVYSVWLSLSDIHVLLIGQNDF